MPNRFPLIPAGAMVCALLVASGRASADEAAVQKFDGGVHVTLGGKPFTDYLTRTGPKPILWPIIGPGGHEMTRNYPMTPGAGGETGSPAPAFVVVHPW